MQFGPIVPFTEKGENHGLGNHALQGVITMGLTIYSQKDLWVYIKDELSKRVTGTVDDLPHGVAAWGRAIVSKNCIRDYYYRIADVCVLVWRQELRRRRHRYLLIPSPSMLRPPPWQPTHRRV